MRSKHDIKNLTASSVSVPPKTSKTKCEVIPPKDVEEDTSYVITTPSQKISPKLSLVVPMDPILNFLERTDRDLSENIYFYLPLVYSL